MFKDVRSKPAPVVVCSAGDFYGTADVFNEAKSHFVARMMGEMGYDAIGVGEMDLNFGLAALVEDARRYSLPIVSANLVARADSLRLRPAGAATAVADRMGTAFSPYRIVERTGATIGFIGLLSPGMKVAATPPGQPAARVESLTYTIEDPFAIARDLVPEVRAACDVLVVLAHMTEDEVRRLATEVPGIDLIVMGHDALGQSLPIPHVVGSTRLLRATSQGQAIGELSLALGSDRRITDARNRIHSLVATYPDDAEMARRLNEFDEENRKLQKELYARESLRKGSDGGPAGDRYLGVGNCQSCHVEQFNVYAGTGHARAYETLASQFVHRDTNCVGCHVTGFGEDGGFGGVRVRGALVDLVDVQCEACHGPGSEHARDGTYKKRAIESCVRCHTPNDDPDFDFAKDWPKIAH